MPQGSCRLDGGEHPKTNAEGHHGCHWHQARHFKNTPEDSLTWQHDWVYLASLFKDLQCPGLGTVKHERCERCGEARETSEEQPRRSARAVPKQPTLPIPTVGPPAVIGYAPGGKRKHPTAGKLTGAEKLFLHEQRLERLSEERIHGLAQQHGWRLWLRTLWPRVVYWWTRRQGLRAVKHWAAEVDRLIAKGTCPRCRQQTIVDRGIDARQSGSTQAEGYWHNWRCPCGYMLDAVRTRTVE